MIDFESIQRPSQYDVLAPDGSEIRILPQVAGGSLAHGQLPVGGTSQAVTHHSVEELWYIIAGEGELWRKQGEHEEITKLVAGLGLSIPRATHFQFRNTGVVPLEFVLVTMPPWSGPDEAILVENYWQRAEGK